MGSANDRTTLMLAFIFTDILMIALGFILYLGVRALPRVEEDPADKKGLLDRWAHSEIPEKIDAAFNSFLAKFLRKLKVTVLKLDNKLSGHIQKIKTMDDNQKGADFSEITGKGEKEK